MKVSKNPEMDHFKVDFEKRRYGEMSPDERQIVNDLTDQIDKIVGSDWMKKYPSSESLQDAFREILKKCPSKELGYTLYKRLVFNWNYDKHETHTVVANFCRALNYEFTEGYVPNAEWEV